MLRRDLLKAGWLGLFAPFLVKIPDDVTVVDNIATTKPKGIDGKRYYSPYFNGLGIAQSIQISINYDLNYMIDSECISHYRYITFPIEALINIEYEHGHEQWSGFNPKNHALQQFNMDRFFHAKFVPGASDFGGHIELDGVQYKLASASVKDKKE